MPEHNSASAESADDWLRRMFNRYDFAMEAMPNGTPEQLLEASRWVVESECKPVDPDDKELWPQLGEFYSIKFGYPDLGRDDAQERQMPRILIRAFVCGCLPRAALVEPIRRVAWRVKPYIVKEDGWTTLYSRQAFVHAQ